MTDDQRLGSALRHHYAEEPESPADLDRVTRSVLGEVHETPQQRHRWWPSGRGMAGAPSVSGHRLLGRASSALTFIAAGVIVTLFGGFLLGGVLITQTGDESAPAAATESRTPRAIDELLAGMVVEEVEPGVLRVVNDGVRDLTRLVTGDSDDTVDVTPDGSIWLSGGGGRYGLFRLGEEPVFDDPAGWPPYLEVAPDGSLWAFGEVLDRNGIFSFDGEAWTQRASTIDDALRFESLAIGPDGTVWVAALDQAKHCPATMSADCSGTVLFRLEEDGSLATIDDWADVYAGDVSADEVAVSPDGDVWLVGMVRWDGPEAHSLLRFDGEGWEVIPGPEGFLNNPSGQSLDVGPDGTLWVHTNQPEEDGRLVSGLARFDDPGWTVFTEADGVREWGGTEFIATDHLHVAPDGSAWVNAFGDIGCGGVARFDGTTWTGYLGGLCVHDLDIGPDGAVWVRAGTWEIRDGSQHWDPPHLYVIRADAESSRSKH